MSYMKLLDVPVGRKGVSLVRESSRHTPCAVCLNLLRHTECAYYFGRPTIAKCQLMMNFHQIKLVDGISRMILPGANQD